MTVTQLQQRLTKLQVQLPVIIEGAGIAALKRLEAEIKIRIFKSGKDSANSSLGHYSQKGSWKKKGANVTGWAAWRQKFGRQINYKDLSFSGQLEKSIMVGSYGNKIVLGIVNQQYKPSRFYPYSRSQKVYKNSNKNKFKSSYKVRTWPTTVKVSEYLDIQNKSDIFIPTEREKKMVREEFLKYFNEKVFNIIKIG